jgi:hypothetical protein
VAILPKPGGQFLGKLRSIAAEFHVKFITSDNYYHLLKRTTRNDFYIYLFLFILFNIQIKNL